ncbi:CPBP family intramembrane glutamic endopeptidase [Bacillus massilinigeriensis]|uniref:CPBP family intramembrane glutamic endopeptidase n=1 Tax=Bacillus massilionigeriensis TaxID=1805475 RepID=UPI00096B326B|nr:CPBP family intramembrane glutamic endopeptidase [Bacillus massilionigeriensis]
MKNRQEELIKQMTDKELLFHLYLTQILLLTISLILGMILFDEFSSFIELFRFNDANSYLIGGTVGLGVVILDHVLMKILPPRFYDDGGLNNRIFRNKGILQIAFIAGVVAFSEEILFRGIIQTHFGLIVSSCIFAIVHFRYLFNWFLFTNIVALSFLIGFIYDTSGNLVETIFMHFVIDFLLGIIISISQKKKDDEQEGITNE